MIDTVARRWVKIDAWHVLKDDFVSRGGLPMMTTLCNGTPRQWDGTFVDALPGGSEESCENCLIILAGGKPKKK